MRTTLLSLLHAGQPILYEAIFGHLEARDALHLLSTCRQIREIKNCLFNVDTQLRRFFDKPLRFRQAMATHKLVVGGSVALKLFSRATWTPGDLDVYTRSTRAVLGLSKLLRLEGYVFEPYSWHSVTVEASIANIGTLKERLTRINQRIPEDNETEAEDLEKVYKSKDIRDVYRFRNPSTNARVEVILTIGLEISAILDGYYSTYIMNFFTYKKAYCLFPYHTITLQQGFRTTPSFNSEKISNALDKYHDRGYLLSEYGAFHMCKLSCPMRPHRRIGDRFTWTIEFPTDDILAPDDIEMPIEANTFGLRLHSSFMYANEARDFEAKDFVYVAVFSYDHKLLKHEILVDSRLDSWRHFLMEMLEKVEKQRLQYYVADPLLQEQTTLVGRDQPLDAEVIKYYNFWYDCIMPGEFLWRGQYPMLQ
ncbi:hypothetical protein TWF694_006671 [Orbilia ellipsospora]|uniref:F-box domain-containing protein n=1 Tax=Orbilia ellipsospora TaxID=2528407 RepID=A0AAV9XNE3_9PEZI